MKNHYNNTRHRSDKSAGMALLEVVFSAVILASVIGTSIVATTQTILLTEKTRDAGWAQDWIQSEVEYLRALSWEDIDKLSASSSFTQPAPDDRFLGSRLIQDRRAKQKIIRLTATWNDSAGTFHNTSSVTFINENGL